MNTEEMDATLEVLEFEERMLYKILERDREHQLQELQIKLANEAAASMQSVVNWSYRFTGGFF